MNSTLRQTPLYDWHRSHGGRLVDFAGWSMPVQYESIVREHQATRTAAGLFDVSHMGRFRLDGGEAAAALLDYLCTRNIADMAPGQVRYSLMTNEEGGILDDVLVYWMGAGGERPAHHLLVVNAGNRTKIWDWIQRQDPARRGVSLTDLTTQTAMIALQGPQAVQVASSVLDVEFLAGMKYYRAAAFSLGDSSGVISRTGYTGEDGCELILPAAEALAAWERLVADERVSPAGLGARDTLRLEAAMPLYGHELDEQINPIQAGLNFAVKLSKADFIGRQALQQAAQDARQPCRVGLLFSGRRVPREHYSVLGDGEVVGRVTSGTFSPTLQKPIAMAYVQPAWSNPGSEVQVDIRGRGEAAEVVPLPFYSRSS